MTGAVNYYRKALKIIFRSPILRPLSPAPGDNCPLPPTLHHWLFWIGNLSPAVRSPDAKDDCVHIRRIRRPQCWRNEVGQLSLQESDGRPISYSTRQCTVLLKKQNPTLGYPEYVWWE